MKISLASDHAGYDLKCEIIKFLEKQGHELMDFGTHSTESVDYPDYIYPAALALSEGKVERAILVDGAGYPSAAIANMLLGVRAAVCFDTVCARLAREHSNTNALCLGGKLIGSLLAKEIINVWLNTQFLGGKYARRLEKVSRLEKIHLKSPDIAPQKVITLQDIKEAFKDRKSIIMDQDTIITPTVLDAIRDLR